MSCTNNATTSPSPSVWIFLAPGLVAASQSGNVIRIGDAHLVVIAAIFGYGLIVFSVFVQLYGGVGGKSGMNQTAGEEEA